MFAVLCLKPDARGYRPRHESNSVLRGEVNPVDLLWWVVSPHLFLVMVGLSLLAVAMFLAVVLRNDRTTTVDTVQVSDARHPVGDVMARTLHRILEED